MEKSSFINSVYGDRRYKADDWAAYFASFIANGVFPVPSTGLQITAGEGMNLIIKAGKAWINGYFYINDSSFTLHLPVADGILKRYVRVVLHWNLTGRSINIQVKNSALASNPVAPALQRDADAYEICLADVLVNNGITRITQADITDRRFDTNLCGIVTGTVKQIDFSTLTTQFDSFFSQYKIKTEQEFFQYSEKMNDFFNKYSSSLISEYESYILNLTEYRNNSKKEYEALTTWFDNFKINVSDSFSSWIEYFKNQSTSEFTTWFESIKGMLDGDCAASFANDIFYLQRDVNRIYKLFKLKPLEESDYNDEYFNIMPIDGGSFDKDNDGMVIDGEDFNTPYIEEKTIDAGWFTDEYFLDLPNSSDAISIVVSSIDGGTF